MAYRLSMSSHNFLPTSSFKCKSSHIYAMTNRPVLVASFFFFILMLVSPESRSCSSYKVTANGKTMAGMNYDSWLEHPRIWFETNGYKTAFTGARPDGPYGFAPQAAMNEHGLYFGTLATALAEGTTPPGKMQIASRTHYLKDILHTCKTVEEVKAYVERYDRSVLVQDVFIYVDKSGKYLVVEPYAVTMGTDDRYVLANFCPSTVSDLSTIKQPRYVNGNAFLKNKIDASLPFCTALSDTMHVCREKLGDGTLLTSIWDVNEGKVNLFFYHDYKHPVTFNLADEFAKGDHSMEIASLFPANAEYQKLLAYKTPWNSPAIDWFLRICAGFFFIASIVFAISYLRKRKTAEYAWVQFMLVPLSLAMMCYMLVLAIKINVFYFPAPYVEPGTVLISISSYLPFLLGLLIIPLLIVNRKVLQDSAWGFIPKWTFTLHNIASIALIGLFLYWGFYDVFG